MVLLKILRLVIAEIGFIDAVSKTGPFILSNDLQTVKLICT